MCGVSFSAGGQSTSPTPRRGLVLAAPVLLRSPSHYYDWYGIGGIIGEKFLNPELTVAQMRTLLASHGTFRDVEDALVFTFKDGGNIKILRAGERVVGLNFLYENYPRAREIETKFNGVMSGADAKARILRQNPYQPRELKVRNALLENKPGEASPTRNLCSTFELKPGLNAVPDQHGDMTRYEFVLDALRNKKVDWFGIEMVPHTMQAVVSDFIAEKDGTPKYAAACARLIEYFGQHWNDQFREPSARPLTEGGQNPYFALLEAARGQGIKVYAMDVDPDYYASNSQMDPLVMGTRNLTWADQLPTKGRGLAFGGLAHFRNSSGTEVQAFYRARAPHQSIRLLESEGKCELSAASRAACQIDLNKFQATERCRNLSPVRCLRRITPFVGPRCSKEIEISEQPKKPAEAETAR